MKKLIIIPLLFLFVISEAQFTKSGGFLRTGSNTFITTVSEINDCPTCDADVKTYLASLTAGIPSATITAINTFIVGLKSDLSITNLSDDFEVMLISANGTSEAALKNIVKREHDASIVGTVTFVVNQGFAGNGTTGYIHPTFQLITDAEISSNTDVSIGAYSRTDVSNTAYLFGNYNSTTPAGLELAPSDGGFANWRGNFANNNDQNHAGTSIAMWIISRTDEYQVDLYRNKVVIGSLAWNGTAYDADIYILARNVNGSAADFDTRQVSFFFIGKGLSSTQVGYIVDRFATYLGSL